MRYEVSSSRRNKKKTSISLLSIEDYIQNSHGSYSNSRKTTLASKNLFQNTQSNKKISEETKHSKLWKSCSNRILKINCQTLTLKRPFIILQNPFIIQFFRWNHPRLTGIHLWKIFSKIFFLLIFISYPEISKRSGIIMKRILPNQDMLQ